MTHTSRHARGGFSLIEILIAVAIIAIIGAVVGPALFKRLSASRVTAAKTSLKGIQQGILSFHTDTLHYPKTLKDLVKQPTWDERVKKKWSGPYLSTKDVPRDPWDNQYVYKLTEGAPQPYELYSYGEKGKGAPKEEWIDVWKDE